MVERLNGRYANRNEVLLAAGTSKEVTIAPFSPRVEKSSAGKEEP